MIDTERREFERLDLQRPCKLYDPASRKYLGGQTRNVSGGGALVELSRPLRLEPGSTVHLGVAYRRRDAVLHGREMIEGRVVRSLHGPETSIVAVRYAEPIEQAAPLLAAA
jgi:hypothetical protein